MATLAYRDILQNANANQHSKTVSSISTDHRTGDSAGDKLKSGVTLGLDHSCFQLLALFDFIFVGFASEFL